jgi:leucine-rich repeat protein SHOC2
METLNLDNNQLTQIPRGIYKMKSLNTLTLRNNKITKIPDTFCHLRNLTLLDVRGNKIPLENIEEIQALLPDCKILY